MPNRGLLRKGLLGLFICCALIRFSGGVQAQPANLAKDDPRDDLSPWGVATGAEWMSAFPVFNPLLSKANVAWLRSFYEWQGIEPKRGFFNWAASDRLVANAKMNRLHLLWAFAYFATWASADGGTRTFPIKDIQFWREYVGAVVSRYHADIKYWEVWNEFNGSFAPNGTPEMYAEMVREASIAAKSVDPTAKIGMSVASFDVNFLDRAIKAGAADHFDFLCVHPYEKLNGLRENGELDFLSMASTLRQMLAANKQDPNIQLWITELGSGAPASPNLTQDIEQATLLAKAYLLSIAAGFQRVFWFEARGPSDKNGRDSGLLRADMTPRLSYKALETLSGVLGSRPTNIGWIKLGDGGYGFAFSANDRPVLAAWAPIGRELNVTFSRDVRIFTLDGSESLLRSGAPLILRDIPIFILDAPPSVVDEARSNGGKSYPWVRSYGQLRTATSRLQEINQEDGLKQVSVSTTLPANSGDQTYRMTDFSRSDQEGHYVYFLVEPTFIPFGARELEITAIVKRADPNKVAGMNIMYESQHGYTHAAYYNIPEGDGWHELKWTISDANFLSSWGWNFRLEGIASPNDFAIKEVKVTKLR